MKPKKINKLFIFLIGFSFMSLCLAVRGYSGNPTAEQLNTPHWIENGPFELSPERGRFALLFSLVENKSFYFSVPIARFATPDLGFKNGHYVSLFAPAVSYLIIPGYIIGKFFGSSQFGAYLVIALFALVNLILIRSIAMRLGTNEYAASLGAVVFLFATPAFSYAATLYQHHISTFLILASLYLVIRWNNWWSTTLVWLLCAASIPVDYPNLFLMFPIAVYTAGRFVSVKFTGTDKLKIRIHLTQVLTIAGVVMPLVFFCWFNYVSYGDPFQFSGTVSSVMEIDPAGNPTVPSANAGITDPEKFLNPELQQKSAVAFFKSRNILNGIYLHFASPDRGILFFAPIVFLGIAGGYVLYKLHGQIVAVMSAIIGADVLLYSMWGDPWGGWAFGSRYLIPAYAVLAILTAIAIDRWKKNLIFILTFFCLFIYSVGVNTLGAVTTGSNPPQVEILGLEKLTNRQELYSFDRNYQFLLHTGSKSYIYQTIAGKYLTAFQYYILVASIPVALGLFLLGKLYFYV